MAMIEDAEQRGVINKDTVIIEPTSGNTGIALAFVAAAKGYKLILTMPETMSIERRTLLAMLGAKLVLTPGAEGMKGAIARAEELLQNTPNSWMPQQFNNPANPAIHRRRRPRKSGTIRRWRSTSSVAAVGTGGTITGLRGSDKRRANRPSRPSRWSRRIRRSSRRRLTGEPVKPGPHKIQGTGAGFVPNNLHLKDARATRRSSSASR